MSWFLRHLNWALAMVLVVPVLPVVIVYNTLHSDMFLGIYVITWALAIVVTCGWVIKQKGRSLFNMLYLLLTIWGIIYILGLKNREN
jgi:predicted membrane channel-forming protein YqfA (hemolysin III family)